MGEDFLMKATLYMPGEKDPVAVLDEVTIVQMNDNHKASPVRITYKAQKLNAGKTMLELLHDRDVIQREALAELRRRFHEFDIECVDVLIGKPDTDTLITYTRNQVYQLQLLNAPCRAMKDSRLDTIINNNSVVLLFKYNKGLFYSVLPKMKQLSAESAQ